MAREIKFRFRDELTKKRFFECRNGEIYITATGCPISIHNHGHADYEDFIVEQYTGLTDKNGTEIYEGDVVQIPCDRKCIVKYADHISAFVLVEIGGNKISNNLLLKIDYASYEVIGNIHENPELLGGE